MNVVNQSQFIECHKPDHLQFDRFLFFFFVKWWILIELFVCKMWGPWVTLVLELKIILKRWDHDDFCFILLHIDPVDQCLRCHNLLTSWSPGIFHDDWHQQELYKCRVWCQSEIYFEKKNKKNISFMLCAFMVNVMAIGRYDSETTSSAPTGRVFQFIVLQIMLQKVVS